MAACDADAVVEWRRVRVIHADRTTRQDNHEKWTRRTPRRRGSLGAVVAIWAKLRDRARVRLYLIHWVMRSRCALWGVRVVMRIRISAFLPRIVWEIVARATDISRPLTATALRAPYTPATPHTGSR